MSLPISGFWTYLGLANGNDPWYLWWSGFGSDLGLFGAIGVLYWHHRCHGCFRWGRHKTTGNSGAEYRSCRKHHPTRPVKPTHDQVVDDHKAAS